MHESWLRLLVKGCYQGRYALHIQFVGPVPLVFQIGTYDKSIGNRPVSSNITSRNAGAHQQRQAGAGGTYGL